MAQTMTRRAIAGVAMLAALVLPVAAGTPAVAAGPTSVAISGHGLPTPLDVRADADPELFAAVLSQVSWMASRAGHTTAPSADRLGPRFTIVVFVKDTARQTYDLYPLARGGPRGFRPAKQPDRRRTSAAWFFGRLNMSETLRLAGVPLPIRPDALTPDLGGGGGGGGGGGMAAPGDETTFSPVTDVAVVISEWRRLFLLNGAVVLLIAAGLAGFALLIRPKT